MSFNIDTVFTEKINKVKVVPIINCQGAGKTTTSCPASNHLPQDFENGDKK